MSYSTQVVTQVTGSVSVDNLSSPMPVQGTVSTVTVPVWNGTTSTAQASTTPAALVGRNGARKQLWINTTGSSNLFLGLGSVSISNYFLKLEAGGFWELQGGANIYAGEVWGVWDGTDGSAFITEIK